MFEISASGHSDSSCCMRSALCTSAVRLTRESCLHAQALMAALEEAADQAGARLKPLDRKGEKAALQAERQALEQQLAAGEDAATALSLAVPLLVQRVRTQAACAAWLCLAQTQAALSDVACIESIISSAQWWQLVQSLAVQRQAHLVDMPVRVQVHHSAVSVPGRALGGVIQALRNDLPEPGHAVLSDFHMDVVALLKAGGPGHAPEVEQRLSKAMPHLKVVALGTFHSDD